VSGLLHERVVNLIRQSRDRGSGELTLTVRPNALYNALAGTDETSEEEPPYRYIILNDRYLLMLFYLLNLICYNDLQGMCLMHLMRPLDLMH